MSHTPKPLIRHFIVSFGAAWFWAFLCHSLMVLAFSNSLPVADQWDSEGFLLFRPWMEGTLTWAQMFSPHNEHRIFFKRAFDLIIFSLNAGHWDNRVIAIANAGIYASTIAILFSTITTTTTGATRRILQVATLLLPLTPANCENTLWGFQSPFYFSTFFAALAMRIASLEKFRPINAAVLFVASLSSLFSIASGLLLAPVVATLLLIDPRQPRSNLVKRTAFAAAIFTVAVLGYAILPRLPDHNVVMARSAAEWIVGTMKVLAWPVPIAAVAWLPLALWIPHTLRRRERVTSADVFFLGLAGWIVLQAVAIGYARGHELPVVPRRYTDLLMLGLVANLYFCCRLFVDVGAAQNRFFRGGVRIAIGGIVASVYFYAAVVTAESLFIVDRTQRVWQAQYLVAQALVRGESVPSDHFSLPYPHLSKMPLFLGSPTVREMLRIDGDVLPDSCASPTAGVLSRLVCALENLLPANPLPAFRRVDRSLDRGETSRCSLDLFSGRFPDETMSSNLPLRFAGWIGPGEARLGGAFASNSILLVSAAGTYQADNGFLMPRSDVARFAQDQRYYWSGVENIATPAQVPPGDYEIMMATDVAAPCRTDKHVRMR